MSTRLRREQTILVPWSVRRSTSDFEISKGHTLREGGGNDRTIELYVDNLA